jgi:hypothetical protein
MRVNLIYKLLHVNLIYKTQIIGTGRNGTGHEKDNML